MRPQVTRLHRQFVTELNGFATILAHWRGLRPTQTLHFIEPVVGCAAASSPIARFESPCALATHATHFGAHLVSLRRGTLQRMEPAILLGLGGLASLFSLARRA